MKKYIKPMLIKFTDEEMAEMIFAGASSNGTYLNNCSNGPHNCSITACFMP